MSRIVFKNTNLPNYSSIDETSRDRPRDISFADEDPFFQKYTVAQLHKDVRMQFIRKVYGLLSMQLFITSLVSFIMYTVEPIKEYVLLYNWPITVASVLAFVFLIVMMFVKEKTPYNLLLLFCFTICIAFTIGISVILTDVNVVINSTIVTFVTFIILTIFTMQSKWDFSGLAPFLLGGLCILIVTGFVAIFLPYSSGLELGMGIGGSVIFCGYILLDTYNIINKMSPDEYIFATISLYLDIINLFLSFLKIFSYSQRD